MNETPESTDRPRERLSKEYEDPHYHDEDEPLPPDETDPTHARPPARGRSARKLPPRRRYEYED
jgi:hypothetical protein